MSVSLEHAQQMLEKGEKIEQEFAEYFTGMQGKDLCSNPRIFYVVSLCASAIVDGDSLTDIYAKVKNVIHEQSGNHMWVPSSENI